MGNSTSKPETKVFTPDAPIDFSASFLSQLESSAESDYSRAQYTEKYIQERVAEELQKLERDAVTKFQKTTDSALSKDPRPELSVATTNEKIEKLTKALQENAKLSKVELSPETESARGDVLACLKANEGKTLNCWDEVAKFEKLVKAL
ncbi:MICOS complex subunit Mic19p [Diutina catenulata]